MERLDLDVARGGNGVPTISTISLTITTIVTNTTIITIITISIVIITITIIIIIIITIRSGCCTGRKWSTYGYSLQGVQWEGGAVDGGSVIQ